MNKSRLSLQTNKIQEHNSNIQFTPKTQTKPYNNIANVLEMIRKSILEDTRIMNYAYYKQGKLEELPKKIDRNDNRKTLLPIPSISPLSDYEW